MFVDYLREVIDKNFPPPPRELQFFDCTTGRQRQVRMPECVIDNLDVGFIKECLEELSPEFRAFVLKAAEMICEAGE